MRTEVVVIGAGQAGLSAAYYLDRTGLNEFAVLDDAPGPGGAWQHRWESLTFGQAHDVRGLPGMDLPTVDAGERASVAIKEYFAAYEHEFDLPIHRPVRVQGVRQADPAEADGEPLLAVDTDEGTWLTRAVINATGTWQKPFWPVYPGHDSFAGRQLHSRDYVAAEEFDGQHVIVIGGGTSAVQLLLEISQVANTTWVTRRAPIFGAPDFDEEARLASVARMEERARAGLPPESVVSATGLPLTEGYRRGMDSGVLYRLPMFTSIVSDGVEWAPELVPPAPEYLSADALLWATGYREGLDHLAPLRLRSRGGGIALDGPEVVADPRVQLVGYGPSATTAEANRAGRQAVRNLRRLLGF